MSKRAWDWMGWCEVDMGVGMGWDGWMMIMRSCLALGVRECYLDRLLACTLEFIFNTTGIFESSLLVWFYNTVTGNRY